MLLHNSRRGQSNHSLRTPPADLNADGDKNLRVTAVYEYAKPENVAKQPAHKEADATNSIDFPVILIPEIATSVNALS